MEFDHWDSSLQPVALTLIFDFSMTSSNAESFQKRIQEGKLTISFHLMCMEGCQWRNRGALQSLQGWSRSRQLRQKGGGWWLWTQTVTHQHREWERKSRPHRANFGVYSFICNGKMEDERRWMSHPISRSWHTSAKWTFRENIIQAPSFSKRNVKTTEVKYITWDNSSCWCGSHHSTMQEECA